MMPDHIKKKEGKRNILDVISICFRKESLRNYGDKYLTMAWCQISALNSESWAFVLLPKCKHPRETQEQQQCSSVT